MCETLGTAGAMQLTDEITIHAATETTVSLMYPQGHRPFHQLFNGDCLPTFLLKRKCFHMREVRSLLFVYSTSSVACSRDCITLTPCGLICGDISTVNRFCICLLLFCV